LVGAALGGGISYLLSRQQIMEARLQRAEATEREQLRRSFDRRFSAYADFLTQVRSYRNGVIGYCLLVDERRPTVSDLNILLRTANSTSALVFLVLESQRVYEGCVAVLEAMGGVQDTIHTIKGQPTPDSRAKLVDHLVELMIGFQNAAKAELGVLNAELPWLVADTTAVAPNE
jgi:hypothetical protein